jgi:hydroxypyruvate isomerase
MKRRTFVQNALLTTAVSTLIAPLSFGQTSLLKPSKNTFKLKFAPHDGMFKHHAGNAILDQIKFMSNQGFTAFEDNEMLHHSLKEQEAIGTLLKNLNMGIGVLLPIKYIGTLPI